MVLCFNLLSLLIYCLFYGCSCRASNKNVPTSVNASSVTLPCSEIMSVEITKFESFSNGSVLAMDDIPTLYPSDMIWNSTNRRNITKMWGCLCSMKHCIRKCCPENTTISVDGRCFSSNNPLLYPFRPELIHPDTKKKFTSNFSDEIRLVIGNPCTYGSYYIDPYNLDYPENYTLLSTGELITDVANYSNEEYCLEALPIGRILPLICFPETDVDEYWPGGSPRTEVNLSIVLLCLCWFAS